MSHINTEIIIFLIGRTVRTTTDKFPENTQYISEVVCCYDKDFRPIPCPRQNYECNTRDKIAFPSIEYDATKRKLQKDRLGKHFSKTFSLFEYKISHQTD